MSECWKRTSPSIRMRAARPHPRVDVLAIPRVRVEVGGITAAHYSSPRILFETGWRRVSLPPQVSGSYH